MGETDPTPRSLQEGSAESLVLAIALIRAALGARLPAGRAMRINPVDALED